MWVDKTEKTVFKWCYYKVRIDLIVWEYFEIFVRVYFFFLFGMKKIIRLDSQWTNWPGCLADLGNLENLKNAHFFFFNLTFIFIVPKMFIQLTFFEIFFLIHDSLCKKALKTPYISSKSVLKTLWAQKFTIHPVDGVSGIKGRERGGFHFILRLSSNESYLLFL